MTLLIHFFLGGENNALTEEDPQTILNELSTTFCRQKFDILFCDETASQSGRILPLEIVSTFCRQNSIKLIVDGTQSCQLLFAKNKQEIMDQVKIRRNWSRDGSNFGLHLKITSVNCSMSQMYFC